MRRKIEITTKGGGGGGEAESLRKDQRGKWKYILTWLSPYMSIDSSVFRGLCQKLIFRGTDSKPLKQIVFKRQNSTLLYRYSKTPIYRASRGKGFRPGISVGPVNRIVKYTNLHIDPVFGVRGKAPVKRGTRYIGAR